eukprot:746062-Hanusia_phi.AAC.2
MSKERISFPSNLYCCCCSCTLLPAPAPCSCFYYYSCFSSSPVDHNIFVLSYPPGSLSCLPSPSTKVGQQCRHLNVGGRVPVRLVEDNAVCSRQVGAETPDLRMRMRMRGREEHGGSEEASELQMQKRSTRRGQVNL